MLKFLYQAQVRSCLEYTTRICVMTQLNTTLTSWRRSRIERRAKRLINDVALVEKRLQSLAHRRKVAGLSVFYRIHFGECALELHNLIPPNLSISERPDEQRRNTALWSIFHSYAQSALPTRSSCVQLRSGIPCPSLCFRKAITWKYSSHE